MPRVDLSGVVINSNPFMPEKQYVQIRFPRSKKRRIRKKWAKQMKNFREEKVIWRVGKELYCHPRVFELVKAQFEVPIVTCGGAC